MKFSTVDGEFDMTFDSALVIYWKVQHMLDVEDVKNYLSGYEYEENPKKPIVVEHNGKQVKLNNELLDKIAYKYRDFVDNCDYTELRFDLAEDAMHRILKLEGV